MSSLRGVSLSAKNKKVQHPMAVPVRILRVSNLARLHERAHPSASVRLLDPTVRQAAAVRDCPRLSASVRVCTRSGRVYPRATASTSAHTCVWEISAGES